MRVYKLSPLDKAELLEMSLEDQKRLFRGQLGSGAKFNEPWTAPICGRFKMPGRKKLGELCDLTAVLAKVNVPVCSERAKAVLEPLLGENAQWLPLDFAEKKYWLLNVLRLVEIDEAKSQVYRYSIASMTPLIERYVFKEEAVASEWLFKTSINTFTVHCTDRLLDLIQREGLTGFWALPLWDSELGCLTPVGKIA
jgi:hypothetical protein